MNALELERRIDRAWKRRYGFNVKGAYLRRAYRSAVVRGVRVNPSVVVKDLKLRSCLFLGDNFFTFDHREAAAPLLHQFIKSRKKRMLLTDRSRRDAPKIFDPAWTVLRKMIRPHKTKVLSEPGTSALDRSDRAMVSEAASAVAKGYEVIVWTGNLRVAPAKLPRRCKEYGLSAVFLASEAPVQRWALRYAHGFVRMAPNVYGSLEASPLLSLERRRAAESGETEGVRVETAKDYFHDCAQEIGKIMEGSRAKLQMRVFTPFCLDDLAIIASLGRSTRHHRFLHARLVRGESAVVPALRACLLSSLNKGHIAEEAAHARRTVRPQFVRTFGKKGIGPWGSALEEAWAFFASLFFEPSRRIAKRDEREDSQWSEVHDEGYRLGLRIFHRWNQSAKFRGVLRDLWNIHYGSEEQARALFLTLQSVTR